MSTDVLGYLIEVVSGRPFDVFVREEILQPLGMVDTDFFVPPEKLIRFADCYVYASREAADSGQAKLALNEGGHRTDGTFRLMDSGEAFHTMPSIPSGGGGLVGTARDYMRFLNMLQSGGLVAPGSSRRILGRKTVAFMMQNHLDGDFADYGKPYFLNMSRKGQGFGLGFAVVLRPELLGTMSSPGECAWGGMASTCFWIDPVEKLHVVFLTQLVPSSSYNFRRELRTLVYQALV